MFDGNHRTRRTINLSGRRAARTLRGKQDILDASKRQRQDRLAEQRRVAAAVSIQRIIRGRRDRQLLLQRIVQQLQQLPTSPNTVVVNHLLGHWTTLWNVRLRLEEKPVDTKQLSLWLGEYAHFLQKAQQQQQQQQQQPTLPPPPLMHHIVRATLSCVVSCPPIDNLEEEYLTILQYALQESPQQQQQQQATWRQLGFATGYRLAVSTLLTGNRPRPTPATSSLLLLAIQRATPDTTPGRALRVTLQLLWQPQPPLEDLSSLLQVLSSSSNQHSSNNDMETLAHNIVAQQSAQLLLKILSLEGSSVEMTIRLAALLFQMSDFLRFATGLVVSKGGEDVETTFQQLLLQQQQKPAAAPLRSSSDDSDSDDEDHDHPVSSAAATSTGAEYGTLPQLNRIMNATHSVVPALPPSQDMPTVWQAARQLGNPNLWLSWGPESHQPAAVSLLFRMLQAVTGLKPRQSASSPFLAKLAFSQDRSSNNNNNSKYTWMEGMWKYVLQQTTTTNPQSIASREAWSVFGDVFTHHLIPLKDDQFLERYTRDSAIISAEQVIVLLRDQLYDLYWITPVRTSEFSPLGDATTTTSDDLARASLLVTGTKLWTTLYERWSRLVRTSPFGDESLWWFAGLNFWDANAVVGQPRPDDDDDDDDGMDVESEDGHEDMHQTAEDETTNVLASSFSDPKIARILTSIPQAVPFDRRVKLFHSLLGHDKVATQNEDSVTRTGLLSMMRGEAFDMTSGRVKVQIRRDALYDDSMQALNQLGRRLKRRVQVSFLNQHGAEEAGIDGGGVFKEFIDDLIKDAFLESSTATYRLFTVTPLETLAVDTSLRRDPAVLQHYEFLGRVLGKAVYESILVDPQFCLPFLNQLLGKQNSLEDLKNYDPEYHANLTKLLSLSAAEIESLGMTFELTLRDGRDGNTRNVELMREGRHTAVSKHNVIQYVHLVAYHRLNVETSAQTRAFLRGFRDLIPAAWVRLFSAYELQKLISGDDSVKGIDVASLKKAMQYASGYHPSQTIVRWFWEIVENEMTADQQRKFLKFMTSCSRQPLLGFGSLDPPPCLQQIRIPNELRETNDVEALAKETPLPTASTCMNLLKLPNYPSKQLMKWKLLAAIEAGAGFELT